MIYGGIFDYTGKKQALLGLRAQLEDPTIWDDPKRSADLQKQIKSLDNVVTMLDALSAKLDDLSELWQLAKEDDDASMQASVSESLRACVQEVEQAEFCRMFSKPHDANDAFVEIHSGSGRTEAQDWAEMLFRMYIRWAEK